MLIIVIIVCTVCICNKISNKISNNENILKEIESSLEYKASESTLRRIEWDIEEANKYLKYLKNIDWTLDGSLDDILYYMPKSR